MRVLFYYAERRVSKRCLFYTPTQVDLPMRNSLRSRVIRVAASNPDLRPYLLPLLKEAKGRRPFSMKVDKARNRIILKNDNRTEHFPLSTGTLKRLVFNSRYYTDLALMRKVLAKLDKGLKALDKGVPYKRSVPAGHDDAWIGDGMVGKNVPDEKAFTQITGLPVDWRTPPEHYKRFKENLAAYIKGLESFWRG